VKWQFNKFLIQAGEHRQKKLALKWVIGASVLVTLLKLVAWWQTSSNAILSDLLEGSINLAASSFALFSLVYASKPRDYKHPFGRGKIEFLAATIEGTLISAVAITIFIKAAYNLYFPQAIESIDKGIVLVGLGAAANFALGRYLKHKSLKLNSVVLAADSKRLLSDCYSSVALVIALAIIYFTQLGWIDSIIAMMAGIFILRTGYKLVKQSVKGLLDATDTHLLEGLVLVLNQNRDPGWIDVKNMRVSDHRMYLYVDCEIVMPWYWSLREVSAQIQKAEYVANEDFKERIELFVQAEPCKAKHCHICRMASCPVRQHPYSRQKAWELKEILHPEVPALD
jgi:cation diffusion facilitator family transporter